MYYSRPPWTILKAIDFRGFSGPNGSKPPPLERKKFLTTPLDCILNIYLDLPVQGSCAEHFQSEKTFCEVFSFLNYIKTVLFNKNQDIAN